MKIQAHSDYSTVDAKEVSITEVNTGTDDIDNNCCDKVLASRLFGEKQSLRDYNWLGPCSKGGLTGKISQAANVFLSGSKYLDIFG